MELCNLMTFLMPQHTSGRSSHEAQGPRRAALNEPADPPARIQAARRREPGRGRGGPSRGVTQDATLKHLVYWGGEGGWGGTG